MLPSSGVELAWQWAPGAWAIADVDAVPGSLSTDRAAARLLAEHVRRESGAVRTPFTIATTSGAVPPVQLQRVLDSVRLSVGSDPTDNRHWATSPIR